MKSLIKIYGKYMLTAIAALLALLFINLFLYAFVLFKYDKLMDPSYIDRIAAQITLPQDGTSSPSLSEAGMTLLRENGYVFAMLLTPAGDVAWDWQLPPHLPRQYTVGDVAGFSKWFLEDYPVKEWRIGEYLLVCGREKNTTWKYFIDFPTAVIKAIFNSIPLYLLCNLLLILAVVLIAGWRFYRSLRPTAAGIDALARGLQIDLPEKGVVCGLNSRLNQASSLLCAQKSALEKRDNARTDWISWVSHDIRTPLSMIVGYADSLSEDTGLAEDQRRQAQIIKGQSLIIRRLIEDLNLTSRLEYGMQPLRREVFSPASFLRSLAASFLNGEELETHTLSLDCDESAEQLLLTADPRLLERAVRNLVNNSFAHNPGGCHVKLSCRAPGADVCTISVRDDGPGIPENVAAVLQNRMEPKDNSPHVMGLRIVKQISEVHGGTLRLSSDRREVFLDLPCTAASADKPS